LPRLLLAEAQHGYGGWRGIAGIFRSVSGYSLGYLLMPATAGGVDI
jgi:hypothetical protein